MAVMNVERNNAKAKNIIGAILLIASFPVIVEAIIRLGIYENGLSQIAPISPYLFWFIVFCTGFALMISAGAIWISTSAQSQRIDGTHPSEMP